MEIPARDRLPGADTPSWAGLDAYVALLKRCWAQSPYDRPAFDRAAAELRCGCGQCLGGRCAPQLSISACGPYLLLPQWRASHRIPQTCTVSAGACWSSRTSWGHLLLAAEASPRGAAPESRALLAPACRCCWPVPLAAGWACDTGAVARQCTQRPT